uniref:Uncharacterized protein n=1 Tax=candidate division WOR-3 bacterium TaxID=2052148 RepID=A0A7C4XL35_UNCW3
MKKRKVLNRINISIFISSLLFGIEIYPRNPFLEHYEIIPPLGRVTSLATSSQNFFATSDNYLLIFDKNTLHLKKSIFFSQVVDLIAYDNFFDEIWLRSNNLLLRFNPNLGSLREYYINFNFSAIGIAEEYLYLSGVKKYRLNRMSGELNEVSDFPKNVKWYKETKEEEIRNYKFLIPYYYLDGLEESQTPFERYPITSLYDDGMYLFVGTDRYGILRYNKLSYNKERIIYGPLGCEFRRARKFDNKYYLLSANGISIYNPGDEKWQYRRTSGEPGDIILSDGDILITFGNQLVSFSGSIVTPISQFSNFVLTLNFDDESIYIGTNNGMYRLIKGSDTPFEFGPSRYAINAIHISKENIYVGGELGFYQYDKNEKRWYFLLNRGVKDICETEMGLYLLTADNQLVWYQKEISDSLRENETLWVLLPFFNIYDIETDRRFVYCATHAGVNYFDPLNKTYNPVYDLPRIRYNYIILTGEDILAISDKAIYRLPLRYLPR